MEIPVIRLTLEHMRHEIVQAFSVYAEEMKGRVARIVKEVVHQFNFDAEVKKLADAILRDQIKKILISAWYEIAWDGEVRKALAEALVRGLSQVDVMGAKE